MTSRPKFSRNIHRKIINSNFKKFIFTYYLNSNLLHKKNNKKMGIRSRFWIFYREKLTKTN